MGTGEEEEEGRPPVQHIHLRLLLYAVCAGRRRKETLLLLFLISSSFLHPELFGRQISVNRGKPQAASAGVSPPPQPLHIPLLIHAKLGENMSYEESRGGGGGEEIISPGCFSRDIWKKLRGK